MVADLAAFAFDGAGGVNNEPTSATSRGMRILHVLAPAPYGGLERVVRSLALEQSRAGHEVHVAAILDPEHADHPLLRAVVVGGVHAHPITVGGREYRRERALVRSLCAELRPDVVHTHGYRTDVLHGPVARSMGIPAVTTVHGFTGGDWKNRLYEFLQIRAFRRADAVVVVSKPLRDQLVSRGIPEVRTHCIFNGWADPIPFLDRAEARATLGIPEDLWCAGFIGRLGREKGPDTFADGIAQLRADTLGDERGVIIGDGEMRAAIAARADASGPGASLHLAGAIEDAGRFVRAFDVLVLSSRTEGTPMVLFEAMAARIPIVATRVGGVPDVVSENEALLVSADDPAALAEAIAQVRSDPAGALARADRAAQRLTTTYAADDWREAYDVVYRSVAGNLGDRGRR